ncbi:MAG: LPP20 family lipoprotein [bacterium]|nr:LPP20 family lipoprotein [bacterium]
MNIKFSLLFLLTILIFSCAGTAAVSKKPVSEPLVEVKEYPSSKFLTAEGAGQSESEARERAKAELSNIFEAKVSSEVINRVRSSVNSKDEETVTRDDEQNIRVLSSVDFKGLEIGKVWHDSKEGNYHALAVLNRHRAREEWQAKIDDIDGRIEAILESIDLVKSKFSRLQLLKKSRRLWLEKEIVVSRLRVLGFSNASITDYDIKYIVSMTNRITSSLIVSINITDGIYGKTISDEITEALSREGYAVAADGGEANVQISGLLKVSPVDLKNPGWEFARASASVVMTDTESGLTVGEITEKKRASHLTYDEAAHKAVKGVSALVAQKVVKYFNADDGK